MFRYGLVVMLVGLATPALADFYVVLEQNGCSVQEFTTSQVAGVRAKIVGNGYKEQTDAQNAMSGMPECKQPL